MKAYLCWSLRQLYLLLCLPTQFECEVDAVTNIPRRRYLERCVYLVKMLPWVAALAALGNLIAGDIYAEVGMAFMWVDAWYGVALGVAGGMAGGVGLGVAAGMTAGVGLGVGSGVALGTALGATWD